MLFTRSTVSLIYLVLLIKTILGRSNHIGYINKRDVGTGIDDFFDTILHEEQNDVVFIIDGSNSIGENDFYFTQKKLLRSFVKDVLYIHTGKTSFAVISHGQNDTSPVLEYITKPATKCSLVPVEPDLQNTPWNKLQYKGNAFEDEEDFGLSLDSALSLLSQGKTLRPDANQTILVLSDGTWNNSSSSINVRNTLMSSSVTIYTIGIGDSVNAVNMEALASRPDYYEEVSVWINLMKKKEYILADLKSPDYTLLDITCDCPEHSQCYCDAISGFTKCLCNPGYTFEANQCTACPVGYYKSATGNDGCLICPQDGTTDAEGSSFCECDNQPCIDPCKSNPCPNEKCIPLQNGTYSCVCPQGKTGPNCDVIIDQCSNRPCLNKGICITGVGTYVCLCPWGWLGTQCEIQENECSDEVCTMGGVCRDKQNSVTCDCTQGYAKQLCGVEAAQGAEVVPRTSMYWLILLPTCTFIILVVMFSMGALVHVLCKPSESRGSPSIAAFADNFSIASSSLSKSPSLVTFDGKCYAEEGIPHPPPLDAEVESKWNVFNSSKNLNSPLTSGMAVWVPYVLEFTMDSPVEKLIVARLDSECYIATYNCVFMKKEVDKAYSLLKSANSSSSITIQNRSFRITENDGETLYAYYEKDSSSKDIACVSKTKQYVVIGIGEKQDEGVEDCRDIVLDAAEYIRDQGL